MNEPDYLDQITDAAGLTKLTELLAKPAPPGQVNEVALHDILADPAPPPDNSELRRFRAQQAFWAVRVRNPLTQRKRALRASLPYVRTRQPKGGGPPIVVSRRQGLSSRQWVRLRKDLNKALKARQHETGS